VTVSATNVEDPILKQRAAFLLQNTSQLIETFGNYALSTGIAIGPSPLPTVLRINLPNAPNLRSLHLSASFKLTKTQNVTSETSIRVYLYLRGFATKNYFPTKTCIARRRLV
jgi:hypothetical protein